MGGGGTPRYVHDVRMCRYTNNCIMIQNGAAAEVTNRPNEWVKSNAVATDSQFTKKWNQFPTAPTNHYDTSVSQHPTLHAQFQIDQNTVYRHFRLSTILFTSNYIQMLNVRTESNTTKCT